MRTELFLVGFLLERAFLLGRSALLAWGSGGARGAGFTRYAKEHSPAHAFSPVTLPRKVPLRIGELSLAKPVIRPFLPIQASCGHMFGLPR